MLLSMVVSLYTSRVVIGALGVEDYGIYNVVGGAVAILGFLNSSMSGATSRFLIYELGIGNVQRIKDTFSSAFIIHVVIALMIFILAETLGLWFLYTKLVIPEDRMYAAFWVYQFSVLAAMINVTQVPYNAIIIAHERMDVYAYIEILNVTLKLLIVYLLIIGTFDKLILYAVLVFIVSALIAFVYRIYCIKHFEECHIHWFWSKKILLPMLSFSGWDLYGNMAGIFRLQGTFILLNIFFGPVVNAAAGITSVVIGSLSALSLNVVTAFRPPMIKSYANKNIYQLHLLLERSISLTSLFLSVCAIPIVVEMHFILQIWLKLIPEYAIGLCQIAIISSFIGNMSTVLLIPIHATGNIKSLSFMGGTIYLLNLLLLYVFLKVGITPYVVYEINCMGILLTLVVNSIILKKQVKQINIYSLWRKKLIPIVMSFVIAYGIGWLISENLFEGWIRLLLVFCSTSVLSLFLYLLLVFSPIERNYVYKSLKKYANRNIYFS